MTKITKRKKLAEWKQCVVDQFSNKKEYYGYESMGGMLILHFRNINNYKWASVAILKHFHLHLINLKINEALRKIS